MHSLPRPSCVILKTRRGAHAGMSTVTGGKQGRDAAILGHGRERERELTAGTAWVRPGGLRGCLQVRRDTFKRISVTPYRPAPR